MARCKNFFNYNHLNLNIIKVFFEIKFIMRLLLNATVFKEMRSFDIIRM